MSYGFHRSVTIDHTKVPNTDQTDFPVLVLGTFSYLATIANGGKINNTTTFFGQTVPADLAFAADAAGVSLYKWGVYNYDVTTGLLEVWIKIPTVATAADTVFYMLYGDVSVTTYQGGAAGTVWTNSYVMVLPVPNGTTLSVADAAAIQSPGQTNVTATTGKIDGGASFNGSSSGIATGTINLSTAHTISFWLNYQNAADAVVASGADNGGGLLDYSPYIDGPAAGNSVYYRSAALGFMAPVSVVHGGLSGLTRLTIIRNGTAVAFYKNGAQIGTTQTLGGNQALGVRFLGTLQGSSLWFQGILDQFVLSSTNRSTDWIFTEYANQNSPTTFTTIGSEVGSGSIFAPANVLDGMGSIRVNRLT